MKKTIKTLKEVALEGKDFNERVARHQAFMNRKNAQVKSLQQSANYAVCDGDLEQFKRIREEWRHACLALEQDWMDHLAIIASIQNPSMG